VRWACEELPEGKSRHLLGIGDPVDMFAAIEQGIDTFDCVAPSRMARNGTLLTSSGRFHVTNARFRSDYRPIDETCDCYTCAHYSRAYLNYLFKAKERIFATLTTIHNERYLIRLVDQIRASIEAGTFAELRAEALGKARCRRLVASPWGQEVQDEFVECLGVLDLGPVPAAAEDMQPGVLDQVQQVH
jgi:queuine tRNA-ribosyltransferase